MKTSIKVLSLLLTILVVLPLFTACDIKEQVTDLLSNFIVFEDETVSEPTTGGGKMVTIQWVQGQKVLKEELVEKGSTLTEWTPNVEGKEFLGWYERPYIKKFDFSKPVTKSMRIYASFKSDDTGVNPETPDWYLIGAGKGDLNKANNWNHEAASANLGLYAGEDGIYKITLNLFAGDQFKMTKDLGWDNEKAIDKMAGFANGSVKDGDGNVVFTAGENNNFVVAEGMDGKYEISYDAEADVMSFKLIEKLDSMPDDIRLIGDVNGWSTAYGEDDYKFVSADGVNWTYTWEVTTPGTFKLYNNLSGVYYPGGVGYDLVIEAGTYTIEFNSNTRNIVVKDQNGNPVDVGFTNNGGGNEGGGTVTPNANPVDKVYVVLNSAWDDASLMGAWVWPGDTWVALNPTADPLVYEVSIPAGANMIIFVDFNAGTGDYNWDNKREQTGDLAVPDKSDDKIYYHVANGSWSNSPEASSGGAAGGNGPATTETITVYFQNNWLWTNVSCHYWGGEESAWPGAAMTKVGVADGYEVYSIDLPVGTTGFLFTGVKNDGSGATDQSPDISTDGLVSGQGYKMLWNGANAVEGFTYDPTACVHNYVNGVCDQCGATVAYTIAGTGAHLGTQWDPSNSANDMEYDAATGLFTKVYTGVAAGDYEFKVTKDHSWAVNWGQGGQGGANFTVNVPTDGSTITITFDGVANVTFEVTA